MGQPEQANSSFSTSLTLFAQLPQGWLSWACFCNTQFTETKDPSWLESAVTAYLQVATAWTGCMVFTVPV